MRGLWLMFPPLDGSNATLSDFLTQYPPSSVPQGDVPWICVHSVHPHHCSQRDEQGDPQGMQREWLDLCERIDLQPSASHIHALARRFHVLSGKWMLFCHRREVDDVWSRIAAAVVSGDLGVSAKVSPASPDVQRKHVICVYVSDYTNRADVLRIRETLRQMGFVKQLAFKADAYTHLRIYRGNEYGIQESIYFS